MLAVTSQRLPTVYSDGQHRSTCVVVGQAHAETTLEPVLGQRQAADKSSTSRNFFDGSR